MTLNKFFDSRYPLNVIWSYKLFRAEILATSMSARTAKALVDNPNLNYFKRVIKSDSLECSKTAGILYALLEHLGMNPTLHFGVASHLLKDMDSEVASHVWVETSKGIHEIGGYEGYYRKTLEVTKLRTSIRQGVMRVEFI